MSVYQNCCNIIVEGLQSLGWPIEPLKPTLYNLGTRFQRLYFNGICHPVTGEMRSNRAPWKRVWCCRIALTVADERMHEALQRIRDAGIRYEAWKSLWLACQTWRTNQLSCRWASEASAVASGASSCINRGITSVSSAGRNNVTGHTKSAPWRKSYSVGNTLPLLSGTIVSIKGRTQHICRESTTCITSAYRQVFSWSKQTIWQGWKLGVETLEACFTIKNG